MHILTEQQKKAIPAVLESGMHESQDEALAAAITGIGLALGTAPEESRRILYVLQHSGVVETTQITRAELTPLRSKICWRLTNAAYALLKSEAKAWIDSQFEAECAALGVKRESVPWIEPSRDVLPLTDLEIARLAVGDPGYREDPDYRYQIAAEIRQLIKKKKRRGGSR
jgi:hypothetical protein